MGILPQSEETSQENPTIADKRCRCRTFRVLYPVMSLRQPRALANISKSMGPKISLVVDDEPPVRTLIASILHVEHFQTLEAGDGSHAFRIVQDLAGGLDLIVSDIQMPNGDGLSLAHAVKNSFPDVPVILVSGNSKPDEGFEFVKKPFVPSTLVSAIRKVAH